VLLDLATTTIDAGVLNCVEVAVAVDELALDVHEFRGYYEPGRWLCQEGTRTPTLILGPSLFRGYVELPV